MIERMEIKLTRTLMRIAMEGVNHKLKSEILCEVLEGTLENCLAVDTSNIVAKTLTWAICLEDGINRRKTVFRPW